MQSKTQLANPSLASRRMLYLGGGVALAVLAATLCWSMWHLREHIREQIANRDGETLAAEAEMQRLDDKTSDESIASLIDPGEQMTLALKISRLSNALGVRLFTADGKFVNAFPAYITEAGMPAEVLARVQELKPVSRFLPRARLADQTLAAETDAAPVALLEVNIPLREPGDQLLAGVAQFLLNGTSIAQEYAELDRRLAIEAILAFLVGGSILAGGLALAFWRVQRANRELAERTFNLLRANRELALAAKTSAVGAVTSHLIHGLKNPLSGLQNFVRERAFGGSAEDETDWQLAVSTTERMQSLIDRVVRVLQEEKTGVSYEVSSKELVQLLTEKVQPGLTAAGLRFEAQESVGAIFSNQEAELILLILENLLQNAVEASPRDKLIRFSAYSRENQVIMEVEDEGPGLPLQVEQKLFSPCASSKKGGSGIGLALSRQLAKHLGGELNLARSTPQGCSFQLILPLVAPATEPEPDAVHTLHSPDFLKSLWK